MIADSYASGGTQGPRGTGYRMGSYSSGVAGRGDRRPALLGSSWVMAADVWLCLDGSELVAPAVRIPRSAEGRMLKVIIVALQAERR